MKRGCAQAQPLFRPVGSSFLFVPGGRAVGLGFFGGTAACGKAAAEGPVEVVAAAAAGAVQRLAHKVESRTALELEIVLDLVQKQASAQRARPSFAGSKPSQNSAAPLPSSPTRWANSAASSVSLRAGKRSRAATGHFGPRPGASRPESCMMQMPESPYSVNCTSPVSRASTRPSAPSSRLAQPLARMPASGLRG